MKNLQRWAIMLKRNIINMKKKTYLYKTYLYIVNDQIKILL